MYFQSSGHFFSVILAVVSSDRSTVFFRSFPGIFGTQQEHYMQVIKQMLWQCLQDQSSQQVNLSPPICCFSTWQGFLLRARQWANWPLCGRAAAIQFITIGYVSRYKCHNMIHNMMHVYHYIQLIGDVILFFLNCFVYISSIRSSL